MRGRGARGHSTGTLKQDPLRGVRRWEVEGAASRAVVRQGSGERGRRAGRDHPLGAAEVRKSKVGRELVSLTVAHPYFTPCDCTSLCFNLPKLLGHKKTIF